MDVMIVRIIVITGVPGIRLLLLTVRSYNLLYPYGIHQPDDSFLFSRSRQNHKSDFLHQIEKYYFDRYPTRK